MAPTTQHPIDSGFGAKSEPGEVLEGIDLSGLTAVVTGGYSGIGLETTRALVNAGTKVHVPARTLGKARGAIEEIRENAGGSSGGTVETGEILIHEMDLADLPRVRSFAAEVRDREGALDLLINNAGIMACPETRVGPGWEMQFAVNHIGHFELTRELLPLLLAAEAPRVIALSSTGHKRSDIRWDDIHFRKEPYDKWIAYGQSKTANALFALGLDRRYRDQGLRAFSVHPGGIMTPLQRHLSNEEMAALGWIDEDGNLLEEVEELFKTPSQGASTTLWAATSPDLEGLGGLILRRLRRGRGRHGEHATLPRGRALGRRRGERGPSLEAHRGDAVLIPSAGRVRFPGGSDSRASPIPGRVPSSDDPHLHPPATPSPGSPYPGGPRLPG